MFRSSYAPVIRAAGTARAAAILRTVAIVFLALLGVAPAVAGDTKLPWEEYDKLIKSRTIVAPMGTDLFGEQVNLYNGALSFSVTDISIPGNNALPVALTRTLTVSSQPAYYKTRMAMADWELDLPRLSGVFATTWEAQRCSGSGVPPAVTAPGGATYPASQYWHGNQAHMPSGGEMLLVRAGVPRPTTGGPHRWVTAGFTYFSCLPSIANGTGEGFLAITPDGTRYWFNWMAQYPEPAAQSANIGDSGALTRRRNVLYATRVEDRFGNYVTYHFSNAATDPARLDRIAASDGRSITLSYNTQGRVATASDGTRTWSYAYSGDTLSAVNQGAHRLWTIDFAAFAQAEFQYDGDYPRNCDKTGLVLGIGSSGIGRITHESGATAEFEIGHVLHGRSNVPKACINWEFPANNPLNDVAVWPRTYDVLGIKRKRITGPGLATLEWTYQTGAASSWIEGTGPTCTTVDCAEPRCLSDSCAGRASTLIRGPNDEWERHVFGNSYRYDEGKLVRVRRGRGEETLQTERISYELAQSGQAFQTPIGTSLQARGDGFLAGYLRPLRRKEIVREGATYVYAVNAFDEFARPTQVTRSSTATGGSHLDPPRGVPSLTVPDKSNTGSYAVTWSGVSSATRYELYHRKNAGSWARIYNGTDLSKTLSGLGSATYDYRARACNAAGCGDYSAIATTKVTLPPAQPPVLTVPATNNTGSYTVSWTAEPAATQYFVYYRKNDGAWDRIYDGAGTSQSLTGLDTGSYDHRVRACNDGGCTGDSVYKTTVVTIPPAGVPTLTAPESDNTGTYRLMWTSVAAASRYQVYYRKNGGNWILVHDAGGNTIVLSGQGSGSYEHRVRACNGGGCAGYSAIQTTVVTLPPAEPPIISAPAANYTGSYTVSWTSVAAATRYDFYYRRRGEDWNLIRKFSNSHALSWPVSGTYDHAVRACNQGGCSESATNTTQVTLPPTGIPGLTVPSRSSTGDYTASWTTVPAATRYELVYRKNGGSWSRIYNSSGTSKLLSGRGDGTYDHKVRACNAGGCATYSAVKTTVVTHPPSGVPTLSAPSSNYTGSYAVSWTGVARATRYELHYRKNGGSWSVVYNGSATSKSLSGLGTGTYEHRVRACNVGGCAGFSAIRATQVTRPPSNPPALSAPSSALPGETFTVSWTAVTHATRYVLQENWQGQGWITRYDGSGRSVTRAFPPGTAQYRVKACNVAGCTAYCATKAVSITQVQEGCPRCVPN